MSDILMFKGAMANGRSVRVRAGWIRTGAGRCGCSWW